jgi:hypothetical protein
LKPANWQSEHLAGIRHRAFSLAAILLLSFSSSLPGFANSTGQNQDFIMNTRGVGHIDRGYVTSDQLLELGLTTPETLHLEGEQSLRTGNIDRALIVLQRSVEMAPYDMEGRILYASALGKKLEERKGNDNALFNFLVKQWLFIYKHSDFSDQQMQSLNNIAALTKTKPKRFESEKKFLGRVLRPQDQSYAPQKVALQEPETTSKSNIKVNKKKSELDTSQAEADSDNK